jgi:hypothetical protein
MTNADRLALLFSLLAMTLAAVVTERIFEAVPHIEDEVAYVWQARLMAEGRLTIPSPPHPTSYLVPFVVDYNGQRFGKYPPGWPAMLSLGIRLGLRHLVNPFLAGLAVWLTYRLGKRLFSEPVGLLAAGLTLTSPFFLMNSGSLLSHPFGLFLSLVFVLGWLDAFSSPPHPRLWLPALVAALALGTLILTRPLTAVAVAIPFALHGIYLLIRGNWPTRRRLLGFGLLVLGLGSVYFLWQSAVTGDALLNPYTLWWPYDKIGFGPGYGVKEGGHTIEQAWFNTRRDLWVGLYDLFGWWQLSWIFLPLGLWAARRNGRAWLASSVFVVIVVAYMTYWIGAMLFGPRYYYEGLFSLTLLSAAGTAWLAGWPLEAGAPWINHRGWRRLRPLGVTFILGGLLATNLVFYLPMRLNTMIGLYTITRSAQEPFLTLEFEAHTPALVIVHSRRWMFYGSLLELQDPRLTTPVIFAWSQAPEVDAELSADFPQRQVLHYYPDEPYRFYIAPRPEEP